MAVWPLVRKELNRLHRKLRKAAMTTLELAGEADLKDITTGY